MNPSLNVKPIVKCCYCGMIEEGGHWHEAVEEVAGLVSHGCCPKCELRVMEQIGLSPNPAPAVAAPAPVEVWVPRRGARTGVGSTLNV